MDTTIIQHIVTSLIQINWQALWLSGAVVAVVALLQFCRVLPRGAYSRWRMGLLLTATLTPYFLCLWTWVSGFFHSSVYEAPFPWLGDRPAAQPFSTISLSNAVQTFVLGCYGLWLVVYPVFIFFKTTPTRRELKEYAGNDPYWSEDESSWQNEVWAELLQRFSIWRQVHIIEIGRKPPMTSGFFRPVIVVPDGFHEDSIGLEKPERFRAVLAHELAHVRYHSLWTLIHRFAVWMFPLPLFPVWLFNWLRKRFMRLQMDTAQASNFIGVETAGAFEMADEPSMASKLVQNLNRLVQWIPDPATLMDVEFELHADFVAVRRGGVDPVVLKEALFDALLFEQQDSELTRLRDKARTDGTVQQVLDAIAKSEGLFGVHHARFMEFPPDKGISLWAKIGKSAASLALVYPVAVAIIPALVFLAETTGSELTQPPAPGFAATVTPQPALPPIAAVPNTSNPVTVATTPPRAVRPEQSPSTELRSTNSPVRTVAYAPTSQNRGAPEIPASSRTTTPASQPQSVTTATQDAFQRVAVLNEQQRMLQENLSRQQRADASLQRQQADFNRNQQILDSVNRNQNQMQTAERVRQADANFARANQQMRQATRFVDQAQAVQTSQVRQQATTQSAIRVDAQAQQAMRQASAFNNVRSAVPYVPPAATMPPRIYTPQGNTYTPPRTYTPPTTFNPPRVYSPPPTPYVPPPTPRLR